MAGFRVVGAVRTVAVDRTGLQPGNIAGPDIALALGQRQTGGLFLAVRAEEAEFHLLGMGGKHGEMRAISREFGPQFRFHEIEFGKRIAHVRLPPSVEPRLLRKGEAGKSYGATRKEPVCSGTFSLPPCSAEYQYDEDMHGWAVDDA